MKLPPLIIASAFILFTQIAFAANNEEGKQLFKTYCDACHGMTGGMDMRKRIAPPIAAVRMHYIGRNPDKASFVNAITGWLEKQDPNRSLMRGAIRRFNIMPPIQVKKEDAIKIASYIYDGNIEQPAGMTEHIQQEHAKRGMK